MRCLVRLLVCFGSTAIYCATGYAGETAAKGGQATTDNGAWQPRGDPYPDPQGVPGHEGTLAETFLESFEVTCKNPGLRVSELKFRVSVDQSGHVDVGEAESSPDSTHRAQVYMNALLWRQNNDVYTLDRFIGILSIGRPARVYQCEKIGGRRF